MPQEKITQWLELHYSFLQDTFVELLRSFTNDVYLVITPSEKFILKLYSPEWRTQSEILWEIELIEYLVHHGVEVASVITAKNGQKVLPYSQDGKDYYAVLFQYAKGAKPTQPFTTDLYHEVGRAAGKFHEVSKGFSSSYNRSVIDLDYLITSSLQVAKNKVSSEEYAFLTDFGVKLSSKINEFIARGLDFGPVHGDLTLDNLHVDKNGVITFYDLDSSGFGWRAMELYGWVVLRPEKKPLVDAYLQGYQEVRLISENDLEAAPYLQAAQSMWLRKGMKALEDPKIFMAQFAEIKTWAAYFAEKL